MAGLTRRRLIGLGAGTVGGGALVGVSGWSPALRAPLRPRSGPRTRLRVPPEARAELADGVRRLRLVAQPGEARLLPGAATPAWGYDGPFGGPVLRARRGETVELRVENRLPETTTVHWHGMRLPAAADGGPHQPIAPGDTWVVRWRIDQPAATLWYHPHPHGATARHVHRGLAGAFLLDDDAAPALPSHYGVDDVPLVLTDRTFTAGNAFADDDDTAQGRLGDRLLVNGTPEPFLEVADERVRLRVVNASPARCYALAVRGARAHLVGTDAGLLPAPVALGRVLVTPGERVELVVDLRPGARAMLVSEPQDLGALAATTRTAGGDDRFDVLELRAAATLRPAPPLPSTLAAAPAAAPAGPPTRRKRLGDNTINGRAMDMRRLDDAVPAGATELWEVANDHHLPHNFHVHGAHFVVADPSGPHELGAKDTVYVPPGGSRRLAVAFSDYSDPRLPYMFHCHLLRHEDDGMMGQFVTVDAADRDAVRRRLGGAMDHG